jgi:hypothetical protein
MHNVMLYFATLIIQIYYSTKSSIIDVILTARIFFTVICSLLVITIYTDWMATCLPYWHGLYKYMYIVNCFCDGCFSIDVARWVGRNSIASFKIIVVVDITQKHHNIYQYQLVAIIMTCMVRWHT